MAARHGSAPSESTGVGLAGPSSGPWTRVVGLAAFVAAAVGANGYLFGVKDHAIHLAWLLREIDPGFLAGDPLVDSVVWHPSWFWSLQAVMLRVVPVEALYAVLWVASVAAILAGTAALARALAPGPVAAYAGLVAAAAVLISRETLASIPSFDSLLLNRVVTLGVLLFALARGVERRYGIAMLLAGLAFLIHATTAVHVAVMIGVAGLVDRERHRSLLVGTGLFLVAASPLLVPMLLGGSALGVPWPPPEVWLENTRLTVSFHHHAASFGMRWALMGMPLLILAAAWRGQRSRALLAYAVAIAGLCVVGTVGVDVLHLPAALQLHLWESTRLLYFLAAASGAVWAVRGWFDEGRSLGGRLLPAVAMACFVLDPLVVGAIHRRETIDSPLDLLGPPLLALVPSVVATVVCLIDWRLPSPSGKPTREPRTASAVGLAAVLLLLAGGLRTPPIGWTFEESVRRGGNCTEHRSFDAAIPDHRNPGLARDEICGLAVMAWARENLPKGAVVAVPPYMEHPVTNFRWAARRSIVASWKDGSEGSFSVEYAREWTLRILALTGESRVPAGWLRAPSRAGERVLEAYRTADTDRFRVLASRFGATHALLERPDLAPELPPLYGDRFFRLYAIRDQAHPTADLAISSAARLGKASAFAP